MFVIQTFDPLKRFSVYMRAFLAGRGKKRSAEVGRGHLWNPYRFDVKLISKQPLQRLYRPDGILYQKRPIQSR